VEGSGDLEIARDRVIGKPKALTHKGHEGSELKPTPNWDDLG